VKIRSETETGIDPWYKIQEIRSKQAEFSVVGYTAVFSNYTLLNGRS
jgi:hypothetical protein